MQARAARLPIALATGVAVVLLSAAVAAGPAAPAAEVEQLLDLPYADADPAQAVDLYLPAGDPGAPLMVWLTGGDWRRSERRSYAQLGRGLAAQGLAVAVASYRSGPVQHPVQAQDAAQALAFVRNRLLLSGRQTTEIFLGGHDAGAHLAALLAFNGRFLAEHGLEPGELRGVVGVSGTYRVDPGSRDRAEVFGLDPLQRLDASPLHHVSPAAPPIRLFVAASDLPGRQAEAANLALQLQAAGVDHAVLTVPGRSFSSLLALLGSAGDPPTEALLAFVAERRPDAPSPTPRPSASPAPSPTASPDTNRPAAPEPPVSGPGSEADLAYPQARLERVEQGNLAWWQVLPEGEVLVGPGGGESLRLLVFVPASGPADPSQPTAYLSWLEHLARAGNRVILPDYAAPGLPPTAWSLRVRRIAQAALAEPSAPGTPALDPDGMAWVGHGVGAVLAANAAAHWFEDGLPVPRVLLAAMPRDPEDLLELLALRRLPADLRLLILAAAADPGRDPALERALWERSAQLPMDWRERLVLVGDAHGLPVLGAGFEEAYTQAPHGRLDAHDWYGTWKWLDALQRCAYANQDCASALGGGREQLDLGSWSDGRPVAAARREPFASERPAQVWLPYALRRPSGR